jgi:PAS domain S-box-containing protein
LGGCGCGRGAFENFFRQKKIHEIAYCILLAKIVALAIICQMKSAGASPMQTTSDELPVQHQAHVHEENNLTILLVDDVAENLTLLHEVLSESGYRVLLATGGMEALQMLRMVTVHLILADAMMPRMDGYQLCKAVKGNAAYAHIPFILYTGDYITREDEALAKKLGVERYVIKTGGLEPLLQALGEVAQQYYGHRGSCQVSSTTHLDDSSFLEQHHAVLISKLEQKMLELEMYAEALARKNRALEESEARYHSLVEYASIALYVVERGTGKVVEVNKQGCALIGYDRHELQEFSQFPFTREGVGETILRAREYVVVEAQWKTRGGELLEVEIGAGPIHLPHKDWLILLVRDITEQKKLKEQMIQSEKMMLMGRLASGIAHEIRNPLAATTLYLQYLLQRLPRDFEEYNSLEAAFEGAQRIQHVVDRTLALARPAMPILTHEPVNEIVERTLGFVRIALHQKSLVLETKLGNNIPPILADAKQIEQALLNIVQNAIDASPPGETITITTCYEQGNSAVLQKEVGIHQPTVIITVRDRGRGFAEEIEKHLFEAFRTTKPQGTGLGLMLTKHILDRHGARIAVKRAKGGGTIVYLLFPVPNPKGGHADETSHGPDCR